MGIVGASPPIVPFHLSLSFGENFHMATGNMEWTLVQEGTMDVHSRVMSGQEPEDIHAFDQQTERASKSDVAD